MQAIEERAIGLWSPKEPQTSTLTYIADAKQPISREAADGFKARVHAFQVRNRGGIPGEGGYGGKGNPHANTPVRVSLQQIRATLEHPAGGRGPTGNPSITENLAESTARGPLSEIWAEAKANGKRKRRAHTAQELDGCLHTTAGVGHQGKRHQPQQQPTIGVPRRQHDPLYDAAQEPSHQPAATNVLNAQGFYQIAPLHGAWHHIAPPHQSTRTDALGHDLAASAQVANHPNGQHQHPNLQPEPYKLDMHRHATPTPSETSDPLPAFAPLTPFDSASNGTCQSEAQYLSEAECARNYALAKYRLVRGWQSLYPGATVPDEESNIPALQVRIQRMRQWAGYEQTVASAQQHLDGALELLQACEPGKVVRISGGVGRGDWRGGIRRWAVGVRREAGWESGIDRGERGNTESELGQEWEREV